MSSKEEEEGKMDSKEESQEVSNEKPLLKYKVKIPKTKRNPDNGNENHNDYIGKLFFYLSRYVDAFEQYLTST